MVFESTYRTKAICTKSQNTVFACEGTLCWVAFQGRQRTLLEAQSLRGKPRVPEVTHLSAHSLNVGSTGMAEVCIGLTRVVLTVYPKNLNLEVPIFGKIAMGQEYTLGSTNLFCYCPLGNSRTFVRKHACPKKLQVN